VSIDVRLHACPTDGTTVLPCCGREPHELPSEPITLDPATVTCPGRTCRHCGDPVARTRPNGGVNPREFPWSHTYPVPDGGPPLQTPKCDNGYEGTEGWEDGTWAEPD
jgi:hypothetical protein